MDPDRSHSPRSRRPAAPASARTALIAAVLLVAAPAAAADCTRTSTGLVPLSELDGELYLGLYPGALYPSGNRPPAGHALEGRARALAIRPLDGSGSPDPAGAWVLLSIGMSNTTQEFCSGGGGEPCASWSFMGQAAEHPAVRRDGLKIVNGALGGQATATWDSPDDLNYDRLRDQVLAPRGLTEAQVVAAWVKLANAGPTVLLPDPGADAFALVGGSGSVMRALAARYPNLRLVFLSGRIYAGYASTGLNPEPFAYESGFAVKWLIEAQIHQSRTGEVDPVAGDLDPERFPWIGWGPYLWTAGMEGRSDGLTWEPGDVQADGTHPSSSGERKVGELLLEFFAGSPVAGCWFLAGLSCG